MLRFVWWSKTMKSLTPLPGKRLFGTSRESSSKTVSKAQSQQLAQETSAAQDQELGLENFGPAISDAAEAHLEFFALGAGTAELPASTATSDLLYTSISPSIYPSNEHWTCQPTSAMSHPLPDPHHSHRPSLTAYAALYNNGRILGLRCSLDTIAVSAVPDTAIVPLSLRPSLLQLTVPHHTWIDRFPLQAFRDNMISMAGIFDEEDFLADIFEMESLHIKPGAASWDPEAWTLGLAFSGKWGYLFQ